MFVFVLNVLMLPVLSYFLVPHVIPITYERFTLVYFTFLLPLSAEESRWRD